VRNKKPVEKLTPRDAPRECLHRRQLLDGLASNALAGSAEGRSAVGRQTQSTYLYYSTDRKIFNTQPPGFLPPVGQVSNLPVSLVRPSDGGSPGLQQDAKPRNDGATHHPD
jgi:hypothetical protein